MKSLNPFICILLFAIVSCTKSNTNTQQPADTKPFEVGGTCYATLQQAVDAAEYSEDNLVKLTQDASGQGAVIKYDCTIDFQTSTYTLDDGSTILADDKYLVLTAENGGLCSEGESPVLSVADSGEVEIAGKLLIKADNIILAQNAFVSTSGFNGELQGDIVLDGSVFFLNDADCRIEVNCLEVKGNNAAFITDIEESSGSATPVSIGKIVSELPYPVMTVKDGTVKAGKGKVHVHKMKTQSVPGTCVSPAFELSICSECGYQIYKPLEGFGTCSPEYLEHHEAVEASDIEAGNVEYWECPLCNKAYADKNATKELSDGIYIMPKSYALFEELFEDLDFEIDLDSYSPQTKSIAIAGIIVGSISLMNGVYGTIRGLVQNSGPWTDLFRQTNEIRTQLDALDAKLAELTQKIDNLPYKLEISNRNKIISHMKFQTHRTVARVTRILNDKQMTEDQKVDSLKIYIKNWAELTYDNISYAERTRDLLHDFHVGSNNVNFPAMWESCVNACHLWEHEGYNSRSQMIENDLDCFTYASKMARLYYSDIKEYSTQTFRDDALAQFDAYNKQYTEDSKASVNAMKARKNVYRRLNTYSATFDIAASNSYETYHAWFEPHATRQKYYFPRDNRSNNAVNSWEVVMNHYNLNSRDYMTTAQARYIYDKYNSGKSSKKSIYAILKEAGFTHLPDSFKGKAGSTSNCILFTKDEAGFHKQNDDDALPRYKIWAWESWRFAGRTDCIGIRTCIRDDATTCIENIWNKSNIKTYGSNCGWIKDPGTKSGNHFTRIVYAEKQ